MAFFTTLPSGENEQHDIDAYRNVDGFIIIKIGDSGYLSLSDAEAVKISKKLWDLAISGFQFLKDAEE